MFLPFTTSPFTAPRPTTFLQGMPMLLGSYAPHTFQAGLPCTESRWTRWIPAAEDGGPSELGNLWWKPAAARNWACHFSPGEATRAHYKPPNQSSWGSTTRMYCLAESKLRTTKPMSGDSTIPLFYFCMHACVRACISVLRIVYGQDFALHKQLLLPAQSKQQNTKPVTVWAGVLLYIFTDWQQITNHQTYKQGFYCTSVSTGESKLQTTNLMSRCSVVPLYQQTASYKPPKLWAGLLLYWPAKVNYKPPNL